MDGKGRERERESETRLHSWEMRIVTMATAAESHMMRRSERERAKKRDRVGGWGVPADDRGGEKGKEMVMR